MHVHDNWRIIIEKKKQDLPREGVYGKLKAKKIILMNGRPYVLWNTAHTGTINNGVVVNNYYYGLYPDI